MRVLVFSDSHKNMVNMMNVINAIKPENIDLVIHLGDNSGDCEHLKNKFSFIKMENINGNCDSNLNIKYEKSFDIFGKKIWICHGHMFDVKRNFTNLTYGAEERNADICLFGHTHEAISFSHNNILYMNPGSIYLPKGNSQYPSYGILNIVKNSDNIVKIDAQIVEIINGFCIPK